MSTENPPLVFQAYATFRQKRNIRTVSLGRPADFRIFGTWYTFLLLQCMIRLVSVKLHLSSAGLTHTARVLFR